jgi:multiple sugar transport system permease protein
VSVAARLRRWAYWGVLWLVSLVFVSPVAWIVLSSFKTRADTLATPPKLLFTPTLDNYVDLFVNKPNFLLQLGNSILLSLGGVVLAVVVSFLAAFCFSRFRPRGTDFLMFLLLSIRMLPGPAVILPVFLMYASFGWKDQHLWLILFYAMFSIPFSVWILKGFLDGVSVRFDETGLVNGGSWLHIIFRVVLPQVKPGLIAAFIFNLIFVWNEFLFNFIIGGISTQNIPYALAVGIYSDGGLNWTFISALTTIYILPPVAFIYLFQKYLLVGMTFGTVRGEV